MGAGNDITKPNDSGGGGGGGTPSSPRPSGNPYDLKNSREQVALQTIQRLLARYPGAKQIAPTLWVTPSGIVIELTRDVDTGAPTIKENGAEQSRAILKSIAAGGGTDGGGAGGSGGGSRLASDDPRYWANLDRQYQLDLMQLEQQYMNAGLDAESARRQALTTLITNRNNTAVDVANISNDVAKTAAQFAANPRDAVAELMYRNQVGGNAFGDMTNDKFGEYGRALAEKAASIFSPVQADLSQARLYRDSIPPVDYLGPEQRTSLGLPPTPAQALTGGGVAMQPVLPTAAPAAPVNVLQQMTDRLKAMSPTEQDAFRQYVTGGNYKPVPKFDMGGVIKARTGMGDAPTSSEGGLNLNLFEPAMVVGMDSGKVYATLAEPRPDGTRRGEQLVVKPLKSEVEKDKKLADGQKAVTQSFGVPKAAQGGTITAGSSPDDFMDQLSQYLGNLGGQGGGTGSYGTPLPSLRLLAGAPANELENDPVAMDYALAGYSALGIDPRTVQAQIRKFSPASAQRVGQTGVRTNFL